MIPPAWSEARTLVRRRSRVAPGGGSLSQRRPFIHSFIHSLGECRFIHPRRISTHLIAAPPPSSPPSAPSHRSSSSFLPQVPRVADGLEEDPRGVPCLSWHPTSALLAASCNKRVFLLDGATGAVLIEVPVILLASWLAARVFVRRYAVRTKGEALAMGALAFALLMASEAALAVVIGDGVAAWLGGDGEHVWSDWAGGAGGVCGYAGGLGTDRFPIDRINSR